MWELYSSFIYKKNEYNVVLCNMTTTCGAVNVGISNERIHDMVVKVPELKLLSFSDNVRMEEQLEFQITDAENLMIEFDCASKEFVETFTNGIPKRLDVNISPGQKHEAIGLLCECERIVYSYRKILDNMSLYKIDDFPGIKERWEFLIMLDKLVDCSLYKWNNQLFHVSDFNVVYQINNVKRRFEQFESELSNAPFVFMLNGDDSLSEKDKYLCSKQCFEFLCKLYNIADELRCAISTDTDDNIEIHAGRINTRIRDRCTIMDKWLEDLSPKIVNNGNIDCLKYEHENGCQWDYYTCQSADVIYDDDYYDLPMLIDIDFPSITSKL